MILLDIGNGRVKAGIRSDDGTVVPVGDASHRERGLPAALESLRLPAGDDLLAACVAGPAAVAALEAWAEGRGSRLRRLATSARAAGVTCAYAEPSRLGADRWAALAGARARTAGPCLVVDAGSAITVDAMQSGGHHLGGWIAPGIGLMRELLHQRTGDLAPFSAKSRDAEEGAEFPTDTRPAIAAGTREAAVGLVRMARERLAGRAAAPVTVFLTGGDAALLAPSLPDALVLPHLVLEGLARLSAEDAG